MGKPNEKAGAVVIVGGFVPEKENNLQPGGRLLVEELELATLNENVDGTFVSDSLLREAQKKVLTINHARFTSIFSFNFFKVRIDLLNTFHKLERWELEH